MRMPSEQKIDVEKVRKNIAVVPFDGGVQIEFHCCGWDFEAVFARDGELREVSHLPAEPLE